MDGRASLNKIAASIRQRNYGEARIQLQAFLKQNPKNAEAWYMLSFTAETPEQRVQAAQRAARLSPENERYNQRLQKLVPARRRGWLLPLVVIVVVVVTAGIIVLIGSGSGDSGLESAGLPTLAELPTLTASPLPTITEPPQVSGAIPLNTELPPSATQTEVIPSPTITDTPADGPETIVAPSAEVFPTVASLVQPTSPATLVVKPSPANVVPQPTLPPPPTIIATIPAPTIPASSPIPATSALPAPTLSVVDVVAVGTARDIGGGELRVLEATRPGETLLRELAGSVPTTPANHNWVIFEMLLVCSGGDNCTPATSAFTLRSNTGEVYTPAASLNLDPVFTPDVYMGGQTWGYLGFIVPTSNAAIWLSLDTGTGEPINFGLQ